MNEPNALAAAAQFTETIDKLRKVLANLELARWNALMAARKDGAKIKEIAALLEITPQEVRELLATPQKPQ
jgi:hypothetical protein